MPLHRSHIEYLEVGTLTPWEKNARTHSPKQLRQLAQSITTFGFTNPILIDRKNAILAGHGRVEAAKSLGIDQVPCVRLEHMTPAQKRAYVIADNKLALNAGWDEDLLAEELGALLDMDLDFEITLTGFEMPEIDALIDASASAGREHPEDDVVPSCPPRRCQVGDIWQLGGHRLICGDALDSAVVAALMAEEQAHMVFSDPPYNVPINGHVGNSGKIKHREFVMASGEMSSDEFTAFLRRSFENMARHSHDGSIHFLCMDWRHIPEILEAGHSVYDELKNLIVWVKDNGGMGSFYRSRHELIFAFKKGKARHQNNFGLGEHGRYRTNVWEYRGVNSLHPERMEDLSLHPTVKPVDMVADAIRDVSGRGEIVLDLFGGSGSTLIAADKTGRRGYLCELDPLYCDTILARWEQISHQDAKLIACGIERRQPLLEAEQ